MLDIGNGQVGDGEVSNRVKIIIKNLLEDRKLDWER